MNFFRYCDFFNIKFHFYFENKYSIFGGLMSISYIILGVIIAIILSLDDIRKLNPITTKSEVPGGEFRTINLKESKIYIPWRLITYEEKFIDHRGILYPMISLIEGRFNEKIGVDLKYYNLKYTLCNETDMVNISNLFKIDTPLNELFCIEQKDIPFGGHWLGENLYYLEVNLFLCENGISYNASDSRCTRIHELVEYTNTTWLFEFYYPVVQFQPTNQEVPLIVIYKNYYYRLSSHTYKLERLYIQENILSDDTSLLSTSHINTSCWGMSQIYGDTYVWTEAQDPLVKSNSSCLFTLDIYMEQGHIYYTRSFRKIFDILSNVFPVLNILLIVIEKITMFIKFSLAKRSVAELLFENSKNFKKKNIRFQERNQNDNFNHINNKINFKMNLFDIHKIQKIDESNFIDFNKYNELNNNNNDNYEMKKENSMRLKNNYSKNESYLELFNSQMVNKVYKMANKLPEKKRHSLYRNNYSFKKNEVKEISSPNRKKKLFPFYYFFMDIFIDKMEKPKAFCCLTKKYLIIYNVMLRIFNISTYVLIFKYYNIYKNIIFPRELKYLNDIDIDDINKKININDKEMMKNLEYKITRI